MYFCLDGRKHIFNNFLFKNISNNKIIEINKNELSSLLDNPLYINKKLIIYDKQCTTCNQYHSDIIKQKKYDISNNFDIINKNISMNYIINYFFNIFKFKCPIKLFHNFNDNILSININLNKSICIHCGVSRIDLLNKNLKYFNKFKSYLDNYTKINNSIVNKQLNKINTTSDIKNDEKIYEDKLIIKTTSDINKEITDNSKYINILSNTFNIHQNYLIFIGILENLNYNDIINLDINEFHNISTSKFSNRYYKINNYIRSFQILYNNLKYSSHISKFKDSNLFIIINNFQKSNGKLSDLLKLPELPNNIINLISFYNKQIHDSRIIDILINILYKNIIYLLNFSITNSKFKIIINDFIKMFLNKILNYDKLYTNFDYFKIKTDFKIKKDDDDNDDINITNINLNINYNEIFEDDDDIDDEDNDGSDLSISNLDIDTVFEDDMDVDSFD